MRFSPPHCPRGGCPSFPAGPFRYRRKGYFVRACDGRVVQRFLCLECHRGFSTQTFRLDHRLRRPELTRALLLHFVSKVTHRQSARTIGCARRTIDHRLRLVGRHCRLLHGDLLERAAARGGISGRFQLDELETYEHSRRLAPVTMPVLIERCSFFVLDLRAATLPARGSLSPADRRRRDLRAGVHGTRRSGSTRAVEGSFSVLERVHAKGAVFVDTDRKRSYRSILARTFGERVCHGCHSSRIRRDRRNPLFAINHTLAMLRDGISRLVRRTWAGAKLCARLCDHAWIWTAWRNYVRAITNRAPKITPGMVAGVVRRKLDPAKLVAWKVFPGAIRRVPGAIE